MATAGTVVLAPLVAVAAACGPAPSEAGGLADQPPAPQSAGPGAREQGQSDAPRAVDPPRRFDVAAGVALPPEATAGRLSVGGTIAGQLPVVLADTTAVVAATDRVLVTDLSSGALLAEVHPDRPSAYGEATRGVFVSDGPARPPVLDPGDPSAAVAALLVEEPGEGTRAPTVGVEVLQVSTADGSLVSSTYLQLSPSDTTGEGESRAGLDVETDPGGAPLLVTGRYGLVLHRGDDGRRRLVAAPATG